MHTGWHHSSRLNWDFNLTGTGECAEALGQMGARARAVLPELQGTIRRAAQDGRSYDGQLAGRAILRIAGAAEDVYWSTGSGMRAGRTDRGSFARKSFASDFSIATRHIEKTDCFFNEFLCRIEKRT